MRNWKRRQHYLGQRQRGCLPHKNLCDYNIETYFCDPYSSWQKGEVEKINGLIREYLPKDTDMNTITNGDIQQTQERLNNRPRKKLGHMASN